MAIKRSMTAGILDPDALDDMIEQLNAYSAAVVESAKNVREEIAGKIRKDTDDTYSSWSKFDVRVDKGQTEPDEKMYSINVDHDGAKNTSTVWSSDLDAYFLEFGAGTLLNAPVGESTHPNPGVALIGSYPSPTAAKNAEYGRWFTPDGGLTIGTQASCGMYNACEMAKDNAADMVRREVEKI